MPRRAQAAAVATPCVVIDVAIGEAIEEAFIELEHMPDLRANGAGHQMRLRCGVELVVHVFQEVHSLADQLPVQFDEVLQVRLALVTDDRQAARREHILDAALRCFARAGFHRTTMHDICREAAVSPGALYIYFDSKEALIAGLCERDRAEFAERFATIEQAPDFLAALQELAAHYFVAENPDKRRFVVEMASSLVAGLRDGQLLPESLLPSYARFVRDAFGARARWLGWQPKAGENDDTRLLRNELLPLVADQALTQPSSWVLITCIPSALKTTPRNALGKSGSPLPYAARALSA